MATLGVSELINQTFHNSNNSQLTAVTVGQLGQLDSVTIGQWARQCLIVNTCKMQMSRVNVEVASVHTNPGQGPVSLCDISQFGCLYS